MKTRKIKLRVSAEIAAYVSFGYLLLQPSWVFSQVPFYQGKTITVISGQEPGGTGDMRLKALLPYLKKHIPGQPNLLPEYMPGGERRLLEINRAFMMTGATFITPPGVPQERVQILREAIAKVFKDPEFYKDYKKMVGEEPSPLMPEEFDAVMKKLPRDREDVELFKKIAGAGPLPGH